MARPARFERATAWFVVATTNIKPFNFNNLNGPPSPYVTPKHANIR